MSIHFKAVFMLPSSIKMPDGSQDLRTAEGKSGKESAGAQQQKPVVRQLAAVWLQDVNRPENSGRKGMVARRYSAYRPGEPPRPRVISMAALRTADLWPS